VLLTLIFSAFLFAFKHAVATSVATATMLHIKGPHIMAEANESLSTCESVLYTCAGRFGGRTTSRVGTETCHSPMGLEVQFVHSGVPAYISHVGSQRAS
jgi:hypothetical protein